MRNRVRQNWLTGLLVAVFLLPSLVPQGYMLKRDAATGLVEITICSGVNPRSAWMDLASGTYFDERPADTTIPPVDSDPATELCPAALAEPSAVGSVTLAVAVPVATPGHCLDCTNAAGKPVLLPPARAPPAIA